MLQQTRVNAVLPYYERFLERFPSVDALARAPEQDLLAAWAGLGYYSRARNLQKAAIKIANQGRFPTDHEGIRALPGIGDYTAAAVASIAFELPHAAVDGNVLRVMSRVSAEPGEIRSPKTRQRLQAVADRLLSRTRPGDFNQAVMELGATLCLPQNPQCLLCPVSAFCEARRQGRVEEFPVKQRRAAAKEVKKELVIVRQGHALLFWKRPGGSRRMAGFWELPEPAQVPAARTGRTLGQFRHTIVNTNYTFLVLEASAEHPGDGFVWLSPDEIEQAPLSTTAKKALALATNAVPPR
jgi:A/G-specific adenine glycosylase